MSKMNYLCDKFLHIFFNRINDKTGITPATNLQRVDDTCIYQSADELKTRVCRFYCSLYFFNTLKLVFILAKFCKCQT